MRRLLSRLTGQPAPDTARPEFADLARVVGFFAQLTTLGVVAAVVYAYGLVGWKFVGSVLWALGCLAAGAAVGFLFGIPKVLQSGALTGTVPQAPGGAGSQAGEEAPTTPPSQSLLSYRQRVNTNLEEISDWLTKIIVGVTLIQLNAVPELIWRLAGVISGSFGAELPVGFGVAVILFFVPVGFLFGYLVTRLYIQGALARAERSIEEEGVKAERVLATRSKEAELEVQDALQTVGRRAPQAAGSPGAPATVVDTKRQLLDVANEYLRFNADSWSERVRGKNELAARMAAIILEHKIPRDELARDTNEGVLLGLAAAVQHSPEPEDVQRLLQAAPNSSRLHVQYRFVLAFAKLQERGFISATDRLAVLQVLNRFDARADESLRKAITALRRRLEGAA